MIAPADDHAFERILDYLRQARGFDFTAYKRTSLVRRVTKRMQTLGVEQFDHYLDRLQAQPDEFNELFNTILINVTGFFRDADVWDYVNTALVPQLLESRRQDVPLRVWSAGSASGQEAYSAAMILAEAVGKEAFRERVKIYATDVDEDSLAEARRAVYSEKQLEGVPPDLREKYFDRAGDLFTFDRDLRRAVIFGRHDLIEDAPISRVDLLLCRNTLMYFNADAQARIIGRFYFSLNPAGFLVLGRAEMLFSHASLFQPVDLKRRVFRIIPKVNHRERLLLLAQSSREDAMVQYPTHSRLRDAAFDASTDPQIVLDPVGVVVAMNAQARRTFSLSTAEIGVPLQDLELSYRPAELRPTLERAIQERREVTLAAVPMEQGNAARYVDVTIVPLFDDDSTLLGSRVTFRDVTPVKALQEELTHSKQELETAYEELQSTNEELETTNEELQSTVEELETTNEELQSTNEELETMNEELQSTNEELQTMNDELRNRGTELNASNAFLEAVFASLRSAVVVLDRDMRVQVWNGGASDLWGLREDEAQRSYFFGLDMGLPVADLHQPIKEVLTGAATRREITIGAITRKGRTAQCRVNVTALLGADRSITGVILLMEELRD
ncbi:MAG TPA: CheR family methyltransferase [Vicinamibacterales bacterium]|jgi:two-component system CheB/CheR fusion protein|nr:CheR family methyltransferase [Vicinamibacterales bacterium]